MMKEVPAENDEILDKDKAKEIIKSWEKEILIIKNSLKKVENEAEIYNVKDTMETFGIRGKWGILALPESKDALHVLLETFNKYAGVEGRFISILLRDMRKETGHQYEAKLKGIYRTDDKLSLWFIVKKKKGESVECT